MISYSIIISKEARKINRNVEFSGFLQKSECDFQLSMIFTGSSDEKVAVNTPTDTRIVSITVTDTNPALAQALADDIRVEASDLIVNTM